ncbi:MAG: alpha/beta family hydrolase [Vicinamibacterales bacterium]
MSPLVMTIDDAGSPLPGLAYPGEGPGAQFPLLFVFAHGAGAGQASPFMRRYAERLAGHGIDVVTFDFPYMAAGRKLPDRPPVLEQAFRAAVQAAVDHRPGAYRAVFVGGKSMGGRMATHLAAHPDHWTCPVRLAGAVALGYPLRPPGPRGGDRVSHLRQLAVPTLVVQGTRDTFGGPEAVREAVGPQPLLTIHPVPTGDHSMKVQAAAGRKQADVETEIIATMAAWVRSHSA